MVLLEKVLVKAFKLLHDLEWKKPLVLQVVWRDPSTLHEFVLTTNVALMLEKKGSAKLVLKIRNCTLKQVIESQYDLQVSDGKKAITSDID